MRPSITHSSLGTAAPSPNQTQGQDFGEIRRPSLSLGWVAADAIWVGSRFVHSCPMFACHHRGTYSSGVTAHVCTRVCGARRERECAALGVKATVGVDRMRFEEGEAAWRRRPCSRPRLPPRLGCGGAPPIPCRQRPWLSGPLQRGLTRLLCCAGGSRSLGLHGCYGNGRPSDEFCRLKHPINTSNWVCRERGQRK